MTEDDRRARLRAGLVGALAGLEPAEMSGVLADLELVESAFGDEPSRFASEVAALASRASAELGADHRVALAMARVARWSALVAMEGSP